MKKIFNLIGVMAILIIAVCSLSSCSTSASSDSNAKTESTSSKPTAKTDNKQYVDLGLPSGTLWATMNVGANRPEDYGDYFAWGETKPKQYYEYSTYKWCNGEHNKLTKYCTTSDYGKVDNKTELDLADDAAYVNWGPQWRMPSKEQLDELNAECKWQWTTRNGVKGCLVTSKHNSASLFLPAAGIRCETELLDAGRCGFYWLRSSVSSEPHLANSLFFEWECDAGDWDRGRRDEGRSVRAVRVSPK